MFAAVMPGLSQPEPWIVWLSLALVAGAYVLPKLPTRVVIAAVFALALGSVGLWAQSAHPPGDWSHCDPWWLLMFFLCI